MGTQAGKCKHRLPSGVICGHPVVWHSYYCAEHEDSFHKYLRWGIIPALGWGVGSAIGVLLFALFSCAW